jgi:hypothetical protein
MFAGVDQYESNVNLYADGQRDWKLQFINHMVRQPREHWHGQQRGRLYSVWCRDGDHHCNLNGGLVQVWQRNSHGGRSVHNHFSVCDLHSDRYPDHADIYLHGNRAGNRIVQSGGYMGRIGWHNHVFWSVHARWYRHRDHNGNLDTGHLKIRHRDNTGWKSDFKRMDMDGR